jgi:hypothetical protein
MRVASRAHSPAHCLDRHRRQRADLFAPRQPCLAHSPDRVRGDALRMNGVFKDRTEQVERMADGDRPRARPQTFSLPAGYLLGRDIAQRDRAEVGAQMMVVQTRVVSPRLRCERYAVKRRLRAGQEANRSACIVIEVNGHDGKDRADKANPEIVRAVCSRGKRGWARQDDRTRRSAPPKSEG